MESMDSMARTEDKVESRFRDIKEYHYQVIQSNIGELIKDRGSEQLCTKTYGIH